MFLRWDRSYIREEIRLWKVMWTLPFPAMALTLIETTITNLRYPVAYSSLGLMLYLSVQDRPFRLQTLPKRLSGEVRKCCPGRR
jgi:hyaluronan synthase